MRKLLFVIDNLGSGGAQNQLSLLAVEFKKKGYDVTIFTYYSQSFFLERIRSHDIKYVNVQKTGHFGINILYALWKLINTEEYDCLISFLNTPNFYSVLASKLAYKKLKVICSYRSKTNIELLGKFELWSRKWVNNNSNYLVANSFHEAKMWSNLQNKNCYKWHTIYNAVDNSRIFPTNSKRNLSTLLVVGSVGPAKNGLLVIKAISKLRSENINVKLIWIGEKNDSIEERREYARLMEELIEEENISDYWTWEKPIHDINYYYNTCGGLILASEVEGLPNVVCEALSAGMPCIVSNVLDHPILIQEDHNGFLFDPKSPESLANAICKLLFISYTDYSRLNLNSILVSNSMFNLSKIIKSYEDIITDSC